MPLINTFKHSSMNFWVNHDKIPLLSYICLYLVNIFLLFSNNSSDATDYEQKLLYLQAMGNLKFGKVTNYLDPIIRDETQSDDIRFVATWIKESVAEQSSPSERRENYETFWPIFENRSAPLELRAAAFIILLTSSPTSARLMSIHTLMENEPNPHLVNFYRTTLLSLAGTTQPCYQKLYVIVVVIGNDEHILLVLL